MIYNIAIDGPAGAGKSTIAKKLAKELEFIYVDTGAMYRAMALCLMEHHVAAEDDDAIRKLCRENTVTLAYRDGEQQVLLNDVNVNGKIRTEEVGKMTSASSKNPAIREKMTQMQKELAKSQNVIMDGRDIGTAVLPDAFLKIYMTADAHERALRRYRELTAKGESVELEKIEQDILARDEQDMNREISPLKKAEDAVLLDTTTMNIDEVVAEMKRLFMERKEAES